MVESRFKQVFKTRFADHDQAWRDQYEVVAMDGFTGFKTAAAEELPDAVAVMDPFHSDALDGAVAAASAWSPGSAAATLSTAPAGSSTPAAISSLP